MSLACLAMKHVLPPTCRQIFSKAVSRHWGQTTLGTHATHWGSQTHLLQAGGLVGLLPWPASTLQHTQLA